MRSMQAVDRETKSRHQRARRAAQRQGFTLAAVRSDAGGVTRDPRAPLTGLWELSDSGGVVILRGKIDAVEQFLFHRPID